MSTVDAADAPFWTALETLLAEHRLIIDRPRGTAHPHYHDLIYPLDYGYLEGTVMAGDGAGIDVWVGPELERGVTGVVLTADTFKRDAELKILYGCSLVHAERIATFLNDEAGLPCLVRLRHT